MEQIFTILLLILIIPLVTRCLPPLGAGAKKADVSSRIFFFFPSGGLEDQSFESWPNATAANATDARKGNARPTRPLGT